MMVVKIEAADAPAAMPTMKFAAIKADGAAG